MAASIQRVRVWLFLALALAGRVAAQFTVLSGTCEAIGRCVRTQNFPQEYQHDDRCVILPPADPGPLLVTGFHTYSSTDKLTVNGQEYSLNVGPVGVVPRGEILWVTDWQNADVGWEICLAPRPPPASPPRPSSPPSPSSPPVVPPFPPVVPPGSNGTEAPSPPPLRPPLPPVPPLPPLLPIPIEVVHYLDFESSSLPTGWHNGDDAVSGTQPWTRRSGSTPSSGTGPSSAYEGTYYMYCEASGGAEGDVFALRFDGIGCKKITSVDWHYHMHGTNPGSLRLVYQPLANGGRRARALTHLTFSSSPIAWEVSGPLGDQWLSASVPLGSGASSLIFEYVRADTWSGDASIDAVAVHCVLDDTPPPLPPLPPLPLEPLVPLAPPLPFTPPHVPPFSPEPPASPPPTLPPHLPLVHPNIVTNGTQLLAAVDAAVAGDQVEVGLLPGVSYELNGTPLAVNGFQLRLVSVGRGATIDAAHLSQVLVVRGGGSLHAERVHFVNGGCTMIEVVDHSNTTLLYGSVGGQRCLSASSAPSGSATFTLKDHSRVTLVEIEVNDIEVTSSASLRGGVLSLQLESTAVLSHCTIRDITATVDSAEGAVITADTASAVLMTSTAISNVRIVASSWCDGSIIFLEDRCVATLSECSFTHIETAHVTWGGVLFARDNSVCSLHGCLVDDFSFGSHYSVSGVLTESRALSIVRVNASIFTNIRGSSDGSLSSVFYAYDRALYEVEDCHISHCHVQAESWIGGLFSGYASGSIATPLIGRHCTAFNCTARSTTADVEGVVARLYTSSLVMEGCTMELMRSVAGDGVEGGIALVYSGSRLIVRGCSFSDVEASGNHVKGGVFRVSAGNVLLLEKTAFSNLRMHTPTVAWGGLVYVAADQQETVTLSHVNLTGLAFDGLLGALGGVVWSTLAEHVVTFDSCRLEQIELSSTGAHARGGVIYTELSAIAVTACDIAHVSMHGAQAAIGGVIAAASAQLSVSSTTINNCTTGGSQNTVGAAIAVYSSAFLTLRGCTITACFAEGTSLGAAVLFRSSDSRVVVRKLLITMPQECTGAFAFSGFSSPGVSVLGLTIDGCVADDLQAYAFGRCSDVTYLNTVSDEVEGLCPTTAACVDAPLSLTSASATSPTCACVSPWYALSTGGHEFPFLWADVLGCATARGAESLLFESDVLVVQTEKHRSTGARRERTAVTLRLNGTDPTAPPTVWSTRIVIDEQAAGPWVWFAEGTGLAFSPEQAIWSLAVFTNASGLAERPEPYNAVAFIEGTAQSGAFALSMPIRLRVTAEISAAHSVWGQASGAAFCSSLPRPNHLLTVGVHAHVPFQACDVDDLPVVHAPSSSPVDTDFNRTFRVLFFERLGAAPLEVLVEPLSGGTFEAELLPSIPGASTLELSLDFEGRKLFELDVRCPDRQSPLPDGSGCGCDGGYTLGAQGECVPCAEGSFKSEVSHAPCTSCAEHFGDRFRASGVRGAASAELCACVSGGFTLAAAEGGGQCLCPAGNELDAASETCVPCSAGTAKAEVSNGKCAPCGRGRQQERLGQVECLVCPPGQFQSETGKATCEVCPPRWNSSVGASRCDFCGRGYFLERLREGVQCSDCLPQADCPYNSTLESLVLRTGHWRASKTSKKIYTCDRGKDGSSSCVGGSDVGRDGQGYCLVNHTGARCLACTQEEGFYYSGDAAQCIECPAIGSRLALLLAPSIPLLAVLALLYWMQFSPLKTSVLKSFSKALRRFVLWLTSKDLMVKVKHVVGFYQVINVIPSVYSVTLPDDYHRILSFVTSFEFDYSSLVYPGKCLPGPVWVRIVTTSTIPLAAICALSVVCILFHLYSAKTISREAIRLGLYMSMPAALLITFCFVTSVSATIFKAWSCQPFQDDPTNSTWHYYLRTNPEIRCSSAEYISAEHDEITGVALPFILVWPVGLPLLYSCLLLLCRSALQERKPTKLSHAIRFLHKEYRAEYYWWEAFDLLRKLLLTGFVLLIPERISFIRLVMAVLTSLSTLLLLLAARPYKTEDNHMIGVAAQLGLTLVFLGAIFTKLWEDIYLIAGEETAEEVMGFPSTFEIVTTMIVFSISLLALVSTLTLYRMLTDRRIRVLRLAPSNHVPELDTAPGKYYHIFLSHIWSTGQDQVSTIKRQLMLLMPGIRAFLDVDDLEDIGNLEQYIDVSATVLVFLSRGYFESRNCGREFRCSCERELPLILLHERDLNKGGQTLAQLRSSCPKPYRPIFDPPAGVSQFEYILPWHRVYVFQLETMKRIGERILLASPTYAGKELPGRLYVPMDLSIQTFGYKTKTTVFVSPHNANAGQVCGEVCDIVGNMYLEQHDFDDHLQAFKDTLGPVGESHRSVGARTTGGSTGASDERPSARKSSVMYRSTAAESSTPRFFVLYLNDQTFMDDPEGLLAQQLRDAQAAKFPIVMLHERSDDLGAVEFGVFFERTPQDLIDNGLYAKLAVPMESGSHRQISLKLAAKAMGATLIALRPDTLANHGATGDKMSTIGRIANWAGKHHHASSFTLKKAPSADLEDNNDAAPGTFVQDDESLLAELDGTATELRRRKSSSLILPKLIQLASRANVSSPRSPHAEEREVEVRPEAILATRRSSWTVSASCSGSGRLPDDDGTPKSSPSPASTQSPSTTSTRTNTANIVTAVPVNPKNTIKPGTAADEEGLSASAIEIVSACSSETIRQIVDDVVAQRS